MLRFLTTKILPFAGQIKKYQKKRQLENNLFFSPILSFLLKQKNEYSIDKIILHYEKKIDDDVSV